MPASKPHSAACCNPIAHSTPPVTIATTLLVKIWMTRNCSISPGDVFEHRDRGFLLRQRSDDFHEFPLEQLVRQQHEEGEEEHHDELIAADIRPTEVDHTNVAGLEALLLDLNPGHAGGHRRLISILECVGRLLHLLHGAGFVTRRPQRPSQLAGTGRQLVDDRQRLPLQRIRHRPATGDDEKEHDCGSDRPRNPLLLQPVNGPVQRIKQQYCEDEGEQHRPHQLQQQNDDPDADQRERSVSEGQRSHRESRAGIRRAVGCRL